LILGIQEFAAPLGNKAFLEVTGQRLQPDVHEVSGFETIKV
jgi:hypothetical protein